VRRGEGREKVGRGGKERGGESASPLLKIFHHPCQI